MSALGIDIDLSTDFLEDHWGEPEAGCEAAHLEEVDGSTICPCSKAATHRFRTCYLPEGMNVCALFAQAVRANPHWCSDCDRLAAECWTVVAI